MPSLSRPARWGALGLLAALLGAVAGYVTIDTGESDGRERSEAPQADLAVPEAAELLGAAPRSVIGLDATTLVHIDLASGAEEVLGEISVPDAAVDPHAARVVFTAPASEDDPVLVLRVAPLDDLDAAGDLGPGTGPLLSPDGAYVAGVETSRGGRVVLYRTDAGAQEPVHLLSEGTWEPVAWTTEHRLVVQSANGAVFTTGPDDPEGTRVQGLRGADLVAVSPAAPEALVRTERGLALRSLEGGASVRVRLGRGRELAAASWSPEGHWIAGGVSGAPPTIAVIEARTGNSEVVADTTGALPEVAWSTGKRHFATLAPRGAEGFDIIVCAVNGTCRPAAQTPRPLRIVAVI